MKPDPLKRITILVKKGKISQAKFLDYYRKLKDNRPGIIEIINETWLNYKEGRI